MGFFTAILLATIIVLCWKRSKREEDLDIHIRVIRVPDIEAYEEAERFDRQFLEDHGLRFED
jgi:hypothetical protein